MKVMKLLIWKLNISIATGTDAFMIRVAFISYCLIWRKIKRFNQEIY